MIPFTQCFKICKIKSHVKPNSLTSKTLTCKLKPIIFSGEWGQVGVEQRATKVATSEHLSMNYFDLMKGHCRGVCGGSQEHKEAEGRDSGGPHLYKEGLVDWLQGVFPAAEKDILILGPH